jgi:hypothetical protein
MKTIMTGVAAALLVLATTGAPESQAAGRRGGVSRGVGRGHGHVYGRGHGYGYPSCGYGYGYGSWYYPPSYYTVPSDGCWTYGYGYGGAYRSSYGHFRHGRGRR